MGEYKKCVILRHAWLVRTFSFLFMPHLQNEDDFLSLLKTSKVITGKFQFEKNETLMDLDVKNIKFIDCEIYGGDFCSSVLSNCVFERVLFRESELIGMVFRKCEFVECRFSNVEPDFSLNNCKVKSLTVTRESIEVALRPWNGKKSASLMSL